MSETNSVGQTELTGFFYRAINFTGVHLPDETEISIPDIG
jgi:hypothetical protein